MHTVYQTVNTVYCTTHYAVSTLHCTAQLELMTAHKSRLKRDMSNFITPLHKTAQYRGRCSAVHTVQCTPTQLHSL